MKTEPLISILELARRTGGDRKAIAGVIKAKAIEPKPMARNGKAKGLDHNDVKVICRTLSLTLGPRDKENTGSRRANATTT